MIMVFTFALMKILSLEKRNGGTLTPENLIDELLDCMNLSEMANDNSGRWHG